MIFDGRPLSDIENEEIAQLVEAHVCERQHLEFKATISLRDDNEKHELLRDLASLANGGGGYLIVGIRDDGTGRAQKFEPNLVGDVDSIRKSIRDLCHDHLHERIIGLESECRKIDGNPIVLVRVPQSDRIPHMVAFQRRTDFLTRYEDGKREMKFSEIREVFIGDRHLRGLSEIKAAIDSLQRSTRESVDRERALTATESGEITDLLNIDSERALSEAYRERFKRHAGDKPFFCISALPVHPRGDLIDTNAEEFRKLIEKPPGSRYAGWDMNFEHFPVTITPNGIQRGQDDFRTVEIWRNGYVELRAEIHSQFCWGQSEEEFKKQPAFNAVVITEYPVALLRFYHALLDSVGYKDDAIFTIQLRGIKGYRIRPRTWFHDASKPYTQEVLSIPDFKLPAGFNPDKAGYEVAKIVFSSFGLGVNDIPAWNSEENKFEFDKLR